MTGRRDTHPLGDRFRPGIVIGGKFTLLRRIAEGGFGAVYEAEDNLIRRRVALKLLHPHVASSPEIVRSFLREAQALARIDHPNVVAVHEMGQRRDGSYYLVQELLVGISLRERLVQRARLDPEEAIEVVVPIMGALVAAHRIGIIHRDLKPDNIVLTRTATGERVPQLIDFGIAKVPRTGTWGASTVLDAMLGTPEYMPPEQIVDSNSIEAPADVWAMGIILFELLAGRCPFEGEPTEVIRKIQTEPLPHLTSMAPDVPLELAHIIHRALDHDPMSRPTMQSLREQVLSFLAQRESARFHRKPSIYPPETLSQSSPLSIHLLEDETAPFDSPDGLEGAAGPAEAGPSGSGSAALFGDAGRGAEDTPPPDEPLSSRRAEAEQSHQVRGAGEWMAELRPAPSGSIAILLEEADHALRINALDDALDHSGRALGTGLADGEYVGRFRLIQAIALHWLGSHASAEQCAAESLRHLPRGGAAWYTAMGYLAMTSGDLGKGKALMPVASDLNALAASAAVTGGHLVAVCRLVVALIRVGSPALAERSLERSLRRAAKYATAEPIVRAWLAVARAELSAHKGDQMRYLRYVASCVDAFTEAGDVRSACLQRVNIGNAYLQLGGYAQAETVLRDALTVAAPMRLRFVASLKANLGFALARLRRAEEAAAIESAALDQCIRQGNRRFECVSRIYMATVHSLQGDLAAAVGSARQTFESSGDFPGIRAYAAATLASLLLLQSQPAEALPLAQEAMDLLEQLGGIEEGEALVRVVYASALHATGDTKTAIARILEAQARLLARADRILDAQWRLRFLEDVPENARTLRLATKWLEAVS